MLFKFISLNALFHNKGDLAPFEGFDPIIEQKFLFSGIAIEFALGMGKPVIYINTPKKIHNSDYRKIGIDSFEDQIRNINGKSLELDDCIYIDREIKDRLNKKRIDNKTIIDFRNKHIFQDGEKGSKIKDPFEEFDDIKLEDE